jgi:hypothetical protein
MDKHYCTNTNAPASESSNYLWLVIFMVKCLWLIGLGHGHSAYTLGRGWGGCPLNQEVSKFPEGTKGAEGGGGGGVAPYQEVSKCEEGLEPEIGYVLLDCTSLRDPISFPFFIE